VIRQPELLLSKVNAVDVMFCCLALFVQPGLQLKSDMSMSIYSLANIAENLMLQAVFRHATPLTPKSYNFFCVRLILKLK
jgi:hypothetical protein